MLEALTFDDVSLIPKYSELESRSEVDTSNGIGYCTLGVPIISSPMDTVTELKMMYAMTDIGGIGIHHRYCLPSHLLDVNIFGGVAISPSLGRDFLERIADSPHPLVVIDVAHGDSKRALDYAEQAVKLGVYVVSGNIANPDAADRYLNIGVKTMRVGIGGGAACSTRVVSGVGVPQLTAIQWISDALDGRGYVIADGGIRNSGDIVKALAAGADAVMIGRLLAGTKEAAGKRYGDGTKQYRGMASLSAQIENGKELHPEGVEMRIKEEYTVKEVVDSLVVGIKAGLAYCGARNIQELRERAEFVRVTHNGYLEGLPRT